jgi:hypothetical protein
MHCNIMGETLNGRVRSTVASNSRVESVRALRRR